MELPIFTDPIATKFNNTAVIYVNDVLEVDGVVFCSGNEGSDRNVIGTNVGCTIIAEQVVNLGAYSDELAPPKLASEEIAISVVDSDNQTIEEQTEIIDQGVDHSASYCGKVVDTWVGLAEAVFYGSTFHLESCRMIDNIATLYLKNASNLSIQTMGIDISKSLYSFHASKVDDPFHSSLPYRCFSGETGISWQSNSIGGGYYSCEQ